MSESSFPFEGGTAVATPPAPPAPLLDEPAGARSRLLLVGGIAVVVVLAVVGYFLFFAGSPAEDDSPAATPPKAVAPAAPAPAAEQPVTTPTKINQRNFGRDPFKALIVEAPVVDTSAASSSDTSTTDTSATGSTGSTSTATNVTQPTATTSHTFRVVSVTPNNGAVDVKVDGKVYRNLHAGEVFATYFKVVLISGTTNAFQYGEEKFNVLGTKRLTIA
jgi:hypothetical protein